MRPRSAEALNGLAGSTPRSSNTPQAAAIYEQILKVQPELTRRAGAACSWPTRAAIRKQALAVMARFPASVKGEL